jgi:hypothetical protein
VKDGGQKLLTRSFYDVVRPDAIPHYVAGCTLPEKTFDHYLKIYDYSRRMVERLNKVLANPRHQLMMIEAAHLGYDLPDLDLFRDELSSYADFLDSFDPAWAGSRRPGTIYVPKQLAQNLSHMVRHNCVMLSHIFNGCLKTDYLRRFKEMKREGLSYAGPAALREIDDLIAQLWAIRRADTDMDRPKIVFTSTLTRVEEWKQWFKAQNI